MVLFSKIGKILKAICQYYAIQLLYSCMLMSSLQNAPILMNTYYYSKASVSLMFIATVLFPKLEQQRAAKTRRVITDIGIEK